MNHFECRGITETDNNEADFEESENCTDLAQNSVAKMVRRGLPGQTETFREGIFCVGLVTPELVGPGRHYLPFNSVRIHSENYVIVIVIIRGNDKVALRPVPVTK
jgi:hypothetical protein